MYLFRKSVIGYYGRYVIENVEVFTDLHTRTISRYSYTFFYVIVFFNIPHTTPLKHRITPSVFPTSNLSTGKVIFHVLFQTRYFAIETRNIHNIN